MQTISIAILQVSEINGWSRNADGAESNTQPLSDRLGHLFRDSIVGSGAMDQGRELSHSARCTACI